jgi:aerobic C4-dicarboxylate transport protein
VANVVQPGAGFNADPATLDANAVADYAKRATTQTTTSFILRIIPTTFLDAFTGSGDLLQVLFVAVLFGYAMTHMGSRGEVVHRFIESCSHIFFSMMNALISWRRRRGGAMATIGRAASTLGPHGPADEQLHLGLLFMLVVRVDCPFSGVQRPALHPR